MKKHIKNKMINNKMITEKQYLDTIQEYKILYSTGEMTQEQFAKTKEIEAIMNEYDIQEKSRFIQRLNKRDNGNREVLTVGQMMNYFLDVLEKMELENKLVK